LLLDFAFVVNPRKQTEVEMTYKEERRRVWQEIMEEWKESGLSGVAYCHRKGCSKSNFFRWKKKFSNEEAASSSFVRVSFDSSSCDGIRILIGHGIEVHLTGRADGARAGKVITALQSVC
jgi:hypothetical protein